MTTDGSIVHDLSCLNLSVMNDELGSANADEIPRFERFPKDTDMVMIKERHAVISLCHNDEVGHCGVSGTIS